jgi:fatty acid desaturase
MGGNAYVQETRRPQFKGDVEMILFVLPLGIVFVMMAFAFMRGNEWWRLPLVLILGYLAYECFVASWIILNL